MSVDFGVPESHLDLLRRPLTAVLTTVGPDGLPQSTAVWYLFDAGELLVSVRTDRQKYRNLLTDPKATLFVIDPDNTARTLEIRAVVQIRPDPAKADAERFSPLYGHAPSVWDPDGVGRATLVLAPRRVVTLG